MLPSNTIHRQTPNHSGDYVCKKDGSPTYHLTQRNVDFLIGKIDGNVDPQKGGSWTVKHFLRDKEKRGDHEIELLYALRLVPFGPPGHGLAFEQEVTLQPTVSTREHCTPARELNCSGRVATAILT